MTLRLHGFLPRSRANGPGWRSVVWVQGCSLGCPGCFNPQTHGREEEEGETLEVAEVMRRISPHARPVPRPEQMIEIYEDGEYFWMVDDRGGMLQLSFV